MPPLTTERYIEPPKPSERELALRREAQQSKGDTYDRMSRVLPQRDKGFGLLNGHVESPKAVYQVDGQPRDEFTRAWLGRASFGDGVELHTDRVRVSGSNVAAIEDSQFTHLALDGEGDMHSRQYPRLGAEQTIDLMNGVNDTLDLIVDATLAESAAKA